MNRLDKIAEQRKIQGLRWKDLAENLPISGEGLRIAFHRGSVDEVYLKAIEKKLGITKPTKESIKEESPQTIDEMLTGKVMESLKPFIDSLDHRMESIIIQLAKIDNELTLLRELEEDIKDKVDSLNGKP